MNRHLSLNLGLAAAILLALVGAVLFGETALSAAQYGQALAEPASGPGEVLWQVRAPRAVCALMVGAALGLAGAVLQGLLRNQQRLLIDPLGKTNTHIHARQQHALGVGHHGAQRHHAGAGVHDHAGKLQLAPVRIEAAVFELELDRQRIALELLETPILDIALELQQLGA